MNRLAVSAFWLVMATPVFSQNQPARQPCPDVDAETLGCELIAWSSLQQPRPLPDATSPPDRQPKETEPEKRRGEEPKRRAASATSQRDQSLQTIAGVIVRNDGLYCLRVSSSVDLPLDDQKLAQRYDGKRVLVTGTLRPDDRILRVDHINP